MSNGRRVRCQKTEVGRQKSEIRNQKSHVWHLFVIRSKNREALLNHISKNAIQSLIHYPMPPHKQNAYQEFSEIKLPITEKIHMEVISLPVSSVMNLAEIESIVKCVNEYF